MAPNTAAPLLLLEAAQEADLKRCKELLQARADVNAKVQNATGTCPLHAAASTANSSSAGAGCVALLLGARAELEGRESTHGRTALMCAAAGGQMRTLKVLLACRADLTLRDAEGQTALELAGSSAAAQVLSGAQAKRPAMPDFAGEGYWDKHYSARVGEPYDWHIGWMDLESILRPLLASKGKQPAVLHLGCGSSALAEDMYDAGYLQQTSVDFSSWVIAEMQARTCDRPEMRWITADATDLTEEISSSAFDVVIDKGTMDAVCCHEKHALFTARFLKEACRVTASGGTFVSISFRQRRDVLRWLRRRAFGWSVEVIDLSHANKDAARLKHSPNYALGIHAYLCKKAQPSHQTESHWSKLHARVLDRPDSDLSSEEAIVVEDERGECSCSPDLESMD